MERLTAEKIAKVCNDLSGSACRAAINKLYLEQDESQLWPINGRFNVTSRAIKKAQLFNRETGNNVNGLEYCYLLESIMSEIVNNSGNW